MIFLSVAFAVLPMLSFGEDFERIPAHSKWVGPHTAAFSYTPSFKDAFTLDASSGRKTEGLSFPDRYASFPVEPEGAENLTYSPDSSSLAFTRGGDLFVVDISSGAETRLTFDGSELVMNGYASWVYYEEILGRSSRYKAFWWSPDSKRLAFYRFDDSSVPMFPIYSPFGQDGTLRQTRYPKCGEPNPRVRIGMVEIPSGSEAPSVVWADFDEEEDQYFGIPFWGSDSKTFYVSREPRRQNTLDLYAVSSLDGSKKAIYHEEYPTWLDWIDGMVFAKDGLYMVRSFETGWEQIYFLSYDGKTLRRLTDGKNWRISILRVDERKGDVYFLANRESTVRKCVYKVDSRGRISSITPSSLNAASPSISPDGKFLKVTLSSFTVPSQIWLLPLDKASGASPSYVRGAVKVADAATSSFDASRYSLPRNISMTTSDGLVLPGYIVYPDGFDPSKKYPVHVDIYGGPDTPMVRESWMAPERFEWWRSHGIIEVTVDCRASGHNGREGLDQIFGHLSDVETDDFVQWAHYLKSLPYVDGEKIGVEGFSFGGTMTARLVLSHSEDFHYGIAGGGVYDWSLYDTHYTERFMDTPSANPEGYASTRTANFVKDYPARYSADSLDREAVEPVMLKLTHGTGDDNVHFQNTLQLIDALQREGCKFDFMIYPDGMHGYRGYQGAHSVKADREFWLRYLVR